MQLGLPVCEDEFGEYCQIPLTQNRFAKVDPEDYLWLSQFRWCCKANATPATRSATSRSTAGQSESTCTARS